MIDLDDGPHHWTRILLDRVEVAAQGQPSIVSYLHSHNGGIMVPRYSSARDTEKSAC